MIDILDKDTRRQLEKIRKEFIDTNNLKNPTDIIIFTDSFSSAAASIFIKSFQNDGGAILVGFNTNPDNDNFIPSQSPSISMNFSNSKEYQNLKSLGFIIKGIPVGETYKDDYKKERAIPLEYNFYKIGHIVNISEPYTDDKLNLFIDISKGPISNSINSASFPISKILFLKFLWTISKVSPSYTSKKFLLYNKEYLESSYSLI